MLREKSLELHRNQSGFTLIELLICVAIISILCGIAVQFLTKYRQQAFDSRAQSDLRNAITAEEALFADSESYAECVDSACDGVLPGFRLSSSVNLSIVTRNGSASYDGISSHPKGAHVYEVDSDVGGLTAS